MDRDITMPIFLDSRHVESKKKTMHRNVVGIYSHLSTINIANHIYCCKYK